MDAKQKSTSSILRATTSYLDDSVSMVLNRMTRYMNLLAAIFVMFVQTDVDGKVENWRVR